MKTIITAWPVDRQLQEKVGIYGSTGVKSQSVGRVLAQLVTAGYAEIHTFVESRDDGDVIIIHCRMVIDPAKPITAQMYRRVKK